MAAHRGSELHTLGWQQEGALRMLQNSADPAVATAGTAARDKDSFEAIARTLAGLRDDETLVVQSGRPVGVLRTHEWAPRVIIATANLVGEWANPDEFRRLEQRGLTMKGETASSWIDIGAQGILHGAYETFAAVAADRFDGSLAGTVTLTAGLGATGGAQPLGITLNGGVAICVEVDPGIIARRVQQGFLDTDSYSLAHALSLAAAARAERRPLSIGVRGNAAAVFPAMLALGAEIDIVTDQSSAHDPMLYLPVTFGQEQWASNRTADPIGFADAARHSMAKQVEAMVGFQDAGAVVFDFGNGIRAQALVSGFADAFAFPGFMHEFIRPRLALGEGPVRWIALSGEPADIATVDEAVTELLPDNERAARWLYVAGAQPPFPGLPARSCWLGRGDREQVGALVNELVAAGQVAAPLVIAHDYVDAGAVAAPYRETEAMRDDSDAVADWPLLSALLATGSGATWVSISGGAGGGRSVQSTQATVADGTALAGAKLARGLANETAFGVARYADAGYPGAVTMADTSGVRLPMRESIAPNALDS